MNEHVQTQDRIEDRTEASEPLFNPLSPDFIRDPYPHYSCLRARRKLVADIVETASRNNGQRVLNPAWTGAILLALEDGFRLHRLIDPETTPADSFLRAVGDLRRAMGIIATS